MDIKGYIASGILEDYAAGLVSDQERREVECLSKIYPEIAAALILHEKDLENFSGQYSRKLPSDFRSRVLQAVSNHQPEGVLRMEIEPEIVSEISPEIKPITKSNQSVVWWLAAATIGAMAFGVWQYQTSAELNKQIAELNESNAGAANAISNLISSNESLTSQLADYYDPMVKKVMLKSMDGNPAVSVAILWNTQTGEVKYDPTKLPTLPEDKQYQLWVLHDGVPSDMGTVPKEYMNIAFASPMKAMNGDAFAITIEPHGGRPTPTLEQLIVMGSTS